MRPSASQIAGGTPKRPAPSHMTALRPPAALAGLRISQSLHSLMRGFGPAQRLAQGQATALPRPPCCPRGQHFLSSLGALGGFLPRPSFPRVYSKSQLCHIHLKHSLSHRLLSVPTHQFCPSLVPSLCNPLLIKHFSFLLFFQFFVLCLIVCSAYGRAKPGRPAHSPHSPPPPRERRSVQARKAMGLHSKRPPLPQILKRRLFSPGKYHSGYFFGARKYSLAPK